MRLCSSFAKFGALRQSHLTAARFPLSAFACRRSITYTRPLFNSKDDKNKSNVLDDFFQNIEEALEAWDKKKKLKKDSDDNAPSAQQQRLNTHVSLDEDMDDLDYLLANASSNTSQRQQRSTKSRNADIFDEDDSAFDFDDFSSFNKKPARDQNSRQPRSDSFSSNDFQFEFDTSADGKSFKLNATASPQPNQRYNKAKYSQTHSSNTDEDFLQQMETQGNRPLPRPISLQPQPPQPQPAPTAASVLRGYKLAKPVIGEILPNENTPRIDHSEMEMLLSSDTIEWKEYNRRARVYPKKPLTNDGSDNSSNTGVTAPLSPTQLRAKLRAQRKEQMEKEKLLQEQGIETPKKGSAGIMSQVSASATSTSTVTNAEALKATRKQRKGKKQQSQSTEPAAVETVPESEPALQSLGLETTPTSFDTLFPLSAPIKKGAAALGIADSASTRDMYVFEVLDSASPSVAPEVVVLLQALMRNVPENLQQEMKSLRVSTVESALAEFMQTQDMTKFLSASSPAPTDSSPENGTSAAASSVMDYMAMQDVVKHISNKLFGQLFGGGKPRTQRKQPSNRKRNPIDKQHRQRRSTQSHSAGAGIDAKQNATVWDFSEELDNLQLDSTDDMFMTQDHVAPLESFFGDSAPQSEGALSFDSIESQLERFAEEESASKPRKQASSASFVDMMNNGADDGEGFAANDNPLEVRFSDDINLDSTTKTENE